MRKTWRRFNRPLLAGSGRRAVVSRLKAQGFGLYPGTALMREPNAPGSLPGAFFHLLSQFPTCTAWANVRASQRYGNRRIDQRNDRA